MDVVAIIPARGGSVGLPGKNIRPMLGIPLVARTVQTALNAKCVNDVYVTSDDQEILRISSEAGATPIIRPAELSNSLASSESALVHALEWMEAQGRSRPDYLVFLQCTSVFTKPGDIERVIEKMTELRASCALSVVEDHGFIWHESAEGFAEGITHDATKPRQRRQDMKTRYRENGAIYAMHVPTFIEKKQRFCGPIALVPVDGPALEIDDQHDWDVVESFMSTHRRGDRAFPTAKGQFQIRAVVTDFDGVHTDDCVTLDQNGKESVRCSRRDGMGIENLRNRGIKLMILSKEANPVVRARAQKLKMDVMNQVDDKLPVLDKWRQEQGLAWEELVYIGNDINDVGCMKAAGLSFAPADAHDAALAVADRALTCRGGQGAIREMSDILISEELIAVPNK